MIQHFLISYIFIGLSRKWSLTGKAISWELLCFTLIAFRLIFYKLFWSLQAIVLSNLCRASAGRLQRPLVNIRRAVLAKQSHYIFRDREIFFMAGKLSMINWTINTQIQQHKSAQRHNAALNMTWQWQPAKPHCQSQEHSTIIFTLTHRCLLYNQLYI